MPRPLTLPESIHVRLPPGARAALASAAHAKGTTPQEFARAAILKAVGAMPQEAKEASQ